MQKIPPGTHSDKVADQILQLKDLGVDEVVSFGFIDPPMPEAYFRGLNELRVATAIIIKSADITIEEKGTVMDLL